MTEMAPESTPLADAAMAFLRRSLADLAAVETVVDLLYLAGEDA